MLENLLRSVIATLLCASAMAGEVTVIKAGSLFDSESGKVIRNAVIVVEDDKITAAVTIG